MCARMLSSYRLLGAGLWSRASPLQHKYLGSWAGLSLRTTGAHPASWRASDITNSLISWALPRRCFSLALPRNLLPNHAVSTDGCKWKLFHPISGTVATSPAVGVVQTRTVVKCSKLGKMKTVKAVAKRFRRTGSGKLKFWPAGNVHNLLSKSHNYRRRVKKARYVNKTQLKTLNKMLIGKWS